MKGQWIGKFTGSNTGEAIINVDDRGDHYEGVAYMIAGGTLPSIPTIYANFRTTDKGKTFKLDKLKMFPINPQTQLPDSWDNVKKFYGKNIEFSKYVNVEGKYYGERLRLNWKTELGYESSCELVRSKVDEPSEYLPKEKIDNWEAYKKHVIRLAQRKFIFRGQKDQGRLRTKFHRTGRVDIERFIREDRAALYKHLSASTNHIFNLKDPDENGAFFNLVQHHGYPTPLLDWTYSPYVAAFFAYRHITNLKASKAKDTEKVRIFVFDKESWEKDFEPSFLITAPFLHLSIMEFIAINNERMIPQQAVSTVTNVDDIEAYIKASETEDKSYLYVIDLPVKDRRLV